MLYVLCLLMSFIALRGMDVVADDNKQKIDLESYDEDGNTQLMHIVREFTCWSRSSGSMQQGDAYIRQIKRLLDAGADVNAGWTLMKEMKEKKQGVSVQYIDLGKGPPKFSVLGYAALAYDTRAISLLMEYDPKYRWSTLRLSIFCLHRLSPDTPVELYRCIIRRSAQRGIYKREAELDRLLAPKEGSLTLCYPNTSIMLSLLLCDMGKDIASASGRIREFRIQEKWYRRTGYKINPGTSLLRALRHRQMGIKNPYIP